MSNELTGYAAEQSRIFDLFFDKVELIKEECSKFKLGDICICKYASGSKTVVEKTSLNTVEKYKVVYISKTGVPWFKKLNSKGKVVEEALPIFSLGEMFYSIRELLNNARKYAQFVPDPAQLDAILLQEEYDPTEEARKKLKIQAEIHKHNKRITIKTKPNTNEIAKFFQNCKAGDKFWTSMDKQFIIQSINKNKGQWDIVTTDINQDTKIFNFSSFLFKRLYSEQPRSFSKESKEDV